MDIHSSRIRSKNMAAIKSKNTKPEIIVRSHLYSLGFRYRIHNKSLPGKPDISNKKKKIAIFINGCFWHSHKDCKYAVIPKTRTEWWKKKLDDNKKRDQRNLKKLKSMKWNILVLWECEIKNKKFEKKILEFISNHSI
tara:strand:+ start:142 stop:555 length:414 start_codon:yes stop_codon:yes gene_type:complete